MLDVVSITESDAQGLVRDLNAAFQYLPLPGGGYTLVIKVHVDKRGRKTVRTSVELPTPKLADLVRNYPEPIDGLDLETMSFMKDRRPL